MQPLEVDGALHCDQFLFPSLTCLMPPLRDPFRALCCVGYSDLAKPGALNESFIFSRRTVHVKADRAARGDFFVGNHSADYQSGAEQHPSARLQYAKHLTQHLGPAWNMAQNVLGENLQPCNLDPVTGFYRDGCCNTGAEDIGVHTVCTRVTAEFLVFSASVGNDLSTPQPEFGFTGLQPGDQWCLCASRWQEALEAGVAPPVVLASTHAATLEWVQLSDLVAYPI